MEPLPAHVRAFLWDHAVAELQPAYLVSDHAGCLVRWGGATESYDVRPHRRGMPADEVFPPLHGLLPHHGPPVHLPLVTTPAGAVVDVHLFDRNDETVIVLVNATRDATRQAWRQQRANHPPRREPRLDEPSRTPTPAVTPGESAIADLLTVLNLAVLERRAPRGPLGFLGRRPEWFTALWPDSPDAESFDPIHSPFLDNFMVDADEGWADSGGRPRRSGIWCEQDRAGVERHLEAIAVNAAGRHLLLIQEITDSHAERVQWLQLARENALSHHQFVREIERKDVLLHCIIHDLRNPMTSIRSCLELLAMEDGMSGAGRGYLEVGLSQLERQDVLIRTILDVFAADVSRFGADVMDDAIDVEECVREVEVAFKPLFTVRRVTLTIDLDGGTGRAILVPAEHVRLVRVLANLVDNALRHSRAGTEVRIGVHRGEDAITVIVDDDGPGLPPEHAHRIFDRFAQTGGRPGNTGLGLHFCRIMIEGWGGTIGHENRTPRGSRFWFRLPAATSPPPD